MPEHKWIQKANLKRGSLRNYVSNRFGKKGFTQRGTIKVSILQQLAKQTNITGRRAKLALTLRGLKK